LSIDCHPAQWELEVTTMTTEPATTEPADPIASGLPADPPAAPVSPESAEPLGAEAEREAEVAELLADMRRALLEVPIDPSPDSPAFGHLVNFARSRREQVGTDDYDAWAADLLALLGPGIRDYLPWLWAALHPGLTPWGVVHEAALRDAPRFLADLRAVAAETGTRCHPAVEVRRLESLERQMRGEPDPEPRHVRISFPPEILDRPLDVQVRWVRARYARLTGAPIEDASWLRHTREEMAFAREAARALFELPLYRLIEETVAEGRPWLPSAYWTLVALGAHRAGVPAVLAEALTQLAAALHFGIPLDVPNPGGWCAAIDSPEATLD
jgi:hypothetical protein